MATLDNKSIRGSLAPVFKYTTNPDKNRPVDGLANAVAYIQGDHSVEQLYSRGHNGCSSNPELAIQQFRACEAMYRQKKGGARESGLAEGKQPIVAEHFFLSFPPHENVPYNIQCEIADKLCESDVLKDFYAMSNRHWNTDNDHSHILVCNTSKGGSHKLGMNNKKRNELRKELDRICVTYGLSVIDDPGLRHNDPEREAFIRQLVEEGKVEVYAPADYEKLLRVEREYDRWLLAQIEAGNVRIAESISKNRQCTQAEAYERWLAEQAFFIREKDKKAAKEREAMLIHEAKAREKAARAYYWDERYRSSKHKDYYYAVRRYDKNGYHKPALVLMIELVYLVATNERLFPEEKKPVCDNTPFAARARDLQSTIDAFQYQREQDVWTFTELRDRIEQVGTDLSEARKGLAYYKRALEKGEDLYNAIISFRRMENAKQKRPLTEEEELVRAEAYRIMAAHKCTVPLQCYDFIERRKFAEKKVEDLEKQIPKLKKDYHDLKFIDSHSDKLHFEVDGFFYDYGGDRSLDSLIKHAESRVEQQSKPLHRENEKIF